MSRIFNQAKVDELTRQHAEVITSMKAMLNRAEDAGRAMTPKEDREYRERDKKGNFLEGMILNENEQVVHAAIRPSIGGGAIGLYTEPSKFASFGDFLGSVRRAGMPGQQPDDRLYASAGLNSSAPSEGGFLVEEGYSSALLAKAFEGGQILSRVRRLPVGPNSNTVKLPLIDETSRATGARWGGIQVFRTAERADLQESSPTLRLVEVHLKKLTGYCVCSDEILEDAGLLQTIISEGFSQEFQFEMENEIIRGDGVSQALGILNSPALITVAKESQQGAKTIQFDNLVKMWTRLPAPSKSNAVWLINQDVEPQLFLMGLLMGSVATPAFLPAGAWGAPAATIFGRPVIPVEYCSTLGTKGDIILADFSQYLLAEKGGLRSASSIHILFKSDETAFRWILRNEGQPLWNAPRTPFQGSTTVSPFVTLNTRA